MAKIVVLATGGTIAGQADRADDALGYCAGQLGVDALLAGVAGLSALLQGAVLAHEQLAQIDSKDMADALWQALTQRCAHLLAQPDVAGLVLTHGSDTLEETAYFLCRALAAAHLAGALPASAASKPVVLTCAMRPATARLPDGPQNLADAISTVRDQAASGVLAVCAGTVHHALAVCKTQPYRLDAFSSGDAGAAGYVEEGRVRWLRHCEGAPVATEATPADAATARQAARLWQALCRPDPAAWPWVEIVSSHAGARGAGLDALVQAGVQGVVLAGTGNATLHHALEQAALRAMQAGVPVWRSSRCGAGQVVPGAASPIPLVLEGEHVLSPQKARVALLLELLAR